MLFKDPENVFLLNAQINNLEYAMDDFTIFLMKHKLCSKYSDTLEHANVLLCKAREVLSKDDTTHAALIVNDIAGKINEFRVCLELEESCK